MMTTGKLLSCTAAQLAAALLVPGFILSGAGCVRKSPDAPPQPPAIVAAATATSRDVPLYLNADGVTTAYQAVSIVSQVEGQIVSMPFKQGTMVKKGDQIAVIFQPPYNAALDRTRGQVAADQANLDLAKLQVERSKQMLADKFISQQQYDGYVAQVKVYEAQLLMDQAQLLTAQINLGYTNITSPVDGMVGTYMINAGNVIKANDQVITTIQTLDPIYADFVVSEADFPTVKDYIAKNNGKLPVELSLLSQPTATRTGELNILGNAVSSATGTVSLRATVANADRLFWPNQPIRARIQLQILKDAVLVPEEAVMLSQNGQYVFVLVPPQNTAVEMRMVQTGPTESDGLKVITDGIKAGERVIVGSFVKLLQAGSPVVLTELDGKPLAPPAGAPAEAAAAAPADKK